MQQDPIEILSLHIDKVLQAHVVSESKSFTLAAQRLNTSQPALSRSIKTLERALGFNIFERSQAGVSSTAKGEQIIETAKKILDVLNQASIDLRLSKLAQVQPIRIGTKEPFAVHIWPPFISWLRGQPRSDLIDVAAKAELIIDKSNARLEDHFRAHKLDALLVVEPTALKQCEQFELFESQLGLYGASHPDKIKTAYNRAQCFIYKEAYLQPGKTLMDMMPPPGDLRLTAVQSFDAAKALATADLGSAILPTWIAHSEIRDRSLSEVKSDFAVELRKMPGSKVYFCLRTGSDKSYANFARSLKKFCREVYLK